MEHDCLQFRSQLQVFNWVECRITLILKSVCEGCYSSRSSWGRGSWVRSPVALTQLILFKVAKYNLDWGQTKEWRNPKATLTCVDNWPLERLRINTQQTQMDLLSSRNETTKAVLDSSSWKQPCGSCSLFSWEACLAKPAGFGARRWCAQSTGQLDLAAHSSTISTKVDFNSKNTTLAYANSFFVCWFVCFNEMAFKWKKSFIG